MKAIQKLIADANKLEQQLASNIAQFAVGLEPLPQDRDTSSLKTAWQDAKFSRRNLARCLQAALREIDTSTVTEVVQRRVLRDARRDLKAAKSRLRMWGRVEPIVTAQLSSERCELLAAGSAPMHEFRVMEQVVNLFLESMHKIANPSSATQGADAKNHGCHRDIPYPMIWFSKMIAAAYRVCLAQRRQWPLRFLDVGSGGGTKVLAAATCFDFCDGLEYDKRTITTGRRFLEQLAPERCRLIHADALRFSDYGKYDVIYFYRPLTLSDRMAEMEERIYSQARPGTVILNAGVSCVGDLPSKNVRRLAYQVYITGMSEAEASDIVINAERMGLMVPGFGHAPFSSFGYWKPLLEVSARNGYYM